MSSSLIRPCALVFCYHFHPATEVASRRLGAFSRTLDANGLDALVISAFGGSSLEPGEPIWPGVYAFPVRKPPRLMVDLMVRLKQLLKGRMDAGGTMTAASEGGQPPAMQTRNEFLASLRAAVFTTLDAIDSYKKWGWLAHREAIKVTSNRDVRVVVASGPPFSGVVSAWLTARRLGVPLVADFRDPMASGARGVKRLGGLDAWLSSTLERRVVRASAAITCASPGICEALRNRHPRAFDRICTVLNGFDGQPTTRDRETQHRLNILFAGMLHVNRDPFPFLHALEALLQAPHINLERIKVRFIGECSSFGGRSLPAWLKGKRAESVVELIPEIPPTALQPYMDEATVLLNFAQGQPRQIPAKTFEHLASGCESLVFCEPDSDTGRLLDGVPGVLRITPGDEGAILRALEALYRRHVVEGQMSPPDATQVRKFSRAAQNELFAEIIRSVVS